MHHKRISKALTDIVVQSLTSETGQTSSSHTEGTSKLIELRGPDRFTTEFEKALLVAQAPVIVSKPAVSYMFMMWYLKKLRMC